MNSPLDLVPIGKLSKQLKVTMYSLLMWGLLRKADFPSPVQVKGRWYFKASEVKWWFIKRKNRPRRPPKTWMINGGVGSLPENGIHFYRRTKPHVR